MADLGSADGPNEQKPQKQTVLDNQRRATTGINGGRPVLLFQIGNAITQFLYWIIGYGSIFFFGFVSIMIL